MCCKVEAKREMERGKGNLRKVVVVVVDGGGGGDEAAAAAAAEGGGAAADRQPDKIFMEHKRYAFDPKKVLRQAK